MSVRAGRMHGAGDDAPAKPMPFGTAVAWFGVPALAFVVCVHAGIPALERAGLEPFVAYLLALLLPLVGLFAAALVLLRNDAGAVTPTTLAERYRFRRMDARDWRWTIVGTVIAVVGMGAVGEVSAFLVSSGIMPLPSSLPTTIDPRLGTLDTLFASVGGELRGRWDLVGLYAIVFFFNIAGEELFWRGYVLPRQVAAHGSRAWVVHGVLWAAFHLFTWWDVLALFPVTLALSFVCQRRGNSTCGLVMHAAINGLGVLGFTAIVAGIVG